MSGWRLNRQTIDTFSIAGYGGFLSLFFGGILASHYLHGDLLLLRPGVPLAYKLPDIALLVHLGVALSLLLAPLHLRFWGLLAAVLAAVAAAFTVYFYGQQPNPAVGLLLYGLGVWLLLEVVPAFYLIHIAFSRAE
ncbi:MAG: hypothetical protein R6X32_07345 [Chloroflexota bacterium]|jgi:hypothetical protein